MRTLLQCTASSGMLEADVFLSVMPSRLCHMVSAVLFCAEVGEEGRKGEDRARQGEGLKRPPKHTTHTTNITNTKATNKRNRLQHNVLAHNRTRALAINYKGRKWKEKTLAWSSQF